MAQRPFAELVQLMEATIVGPSQDKLDAITEKMREARDLRLEISEIEETLKHAKKNYLNIVHRELPDMMNEANQGTMRLLAEGNHPAYQFNLKPFYKAVINNEDENAPKAYRWLDEHGEGDIIKRTVTASLGKESKELQEKLCEFLAEHGVEYDTKLGVPWNTLTAWLKERHRQYMHQDPTAEDQIEMPDLELFGATIGQVVDIKEAK